MAPLILDSSDYLSSGSISLGKCWRLNNESQTEKSVVMMPLWLDGPRCRLCKDLVSVPIRLVTRSNMEECNHPNLELRQRTPETH
ncbi:unnamed protein product [Protopolystoma xenopodis]|uniref:Uncharacterized protein n=1 Tax=Protopolystoma xenopodis TaxID=117903 RepID=A0A448X6N3_9PLAT|nr:unnamed protein product [Protopolystoma xenopodis]